MFKRKIIVTAFAMLIALSSAWSLASAGVQSATLHIHAEVARGRIVNVHNVNAPWEELTITWNNFGGAFDPAVINSFSPTVVGWHAIDVTTLVQSWDGVVPNFGMLLEQDLGNRFERNIYTSREGGANMPILEVTFSTSSGTVTEFIPAEADAYIWDLYPDTNNGDDVNIFTGGSTNPAHLNKQSLLYFDIHFGPAPDARTPGYWKNHSEYGPAPYDPTWSLLSDGADTSFFLSKQTYYEVLWTKPKKGNAYYILSRAFIAAELNGLAGVPFPADVQAAFDAAELLFMAYTPADIGALKGKAPLRKDFLGLADILDDFNNGR